jgi:L-alanine-DL-glutamate epimerase-like enolase superfamily enzyme
MPSAAPKIARIDGFEIACRLGAPIGNAWQMFDTRASLLVSVTADTGAVGWGETWGETWAHPEVPMSARISARSRTRSAGPWRPRARR